jgi:hypothetical protein
MGFTQTGKKYSSIPLTPLEYFQKQLCTFRYRYRYLKFHLCVPVPVL